MDSIFCGNDITALGAIDAARQLGIKVPDALSIVGFDDITMASWPSYSLTTWKQPIDDMVDTTVQLLLEEINEKTNKVITRSLPGELIVRGSVKDK
nr:substrate-binding domain-containing protein [Bacillus sp. LL01]